MPGQPDRNRKKAYVEGVFINRDSEAMKKGFHPEFSKADYHDGHTHTYDLAQWCADIDRLKANSGKSDANITHKFPMVDITDKAAVAKVEIYRDGKLIITDYLSLYKLDDSWMIMNKISISPS